MNVQSQFEEIMAQALADVAIPLVMKRSEDLIRDLRQIVLYSQLNFRRAAYSF